MDSSTQFPPSSATFKQQATSSVVNTSGKKQRFRQLTTRPVVGAAFIDGGIRYAERGTGYLYDILFSNGNESQVSNTTIPKVAEALFSPQGTYVALTTEDGNAKGVVVGSLKQGGGSLDGKALPEGAYEVGFVGTSSVQYLLQTESGSKAYAYNLVTNTSSQLFSLPLRDVHMLWGKDPLVYPTPSSHLFGRLYRISGTSLRYATGEGRGLTALQLQGGLLVSMLSSGEKGAMTSSVFTASSTGKALSVGFLADKCVSGIATGTAYCAGEPPQLPDEYPDSWYKGVVSMKDLFWKISLDASSVSLIADPVDETGREIDVLTMGINPSGTMLWFINKNDGTLWTLDLTP